MVQYKLNYFDVRGLAETVRVMFHYAGVAFEDRRFTHAEWPQIKSEAPFGKAPWLEIDGKPLPESFAIFRYLSTKFGLAGKDDYEHAYVDAIGNFYRDFLTEARPYFIILAGFAEGNAAEKEKEVFWPNAEKTYGKLQELLKASGSGYFMKSGLTWVDIFIAESTLTFTGYNAEIAKKYPAIVEHMKKVHSNDKIKKYIESRKKLPY